MLRQIWAPYEETQAGSEFVPWSAVGVANGVASLGSDGKVPASQLPTIVIGNTYVVADEAARLALAGTANVGDVAKQTDNGIAYILAQLTGSQDSDWVPIGDSIINLTTDVTGILPPANGGTGADLSAATTGYFPYFGVAGVMSAFDLFGSNNTWTGMQGVGIAPSVKLHVSGDAVVPAAALYNAATDYMMVSGNGNVQSRVLGADNVTAANSPVFILGRARGTLAVPLIVASGDTVGSVIGQGYDGAARVTLARIDFMVDGTPGSGDMPGRITLSTCPDGSTTAVERFRWDNAGNVGLGQTSFGTGAVRVFSIASGTGPSTSTTDAIQMWSADRAAVATTAGLNLRAESGFQYIFSDRMGVGTLTPSATVHIFVGSSAQSAPGGTTCILESNTNVTMHMLGADTGFFQMSYGCPTAITRGAIGYTGPTFSGGIPVDTWFIRTSGSERFYFVGSAGNFGIAVSAFGTSATKGIGIGSGVAPSTSPADMIHMWSADRAATAGKASWHVRTEDGTSHVLGDLSGIATVSPNSTLHVAGSVASAFTAQTSSTLAVDGTHSTISCDTTSNNITCTLPTAVGITGRKYTFKRISAGANTLTIATTSSQTIDGATTLSIPAQYTAVTVVSNNANWLVL